MPLASGTVLDAIVQRVRGLTAEAEILVATSSNNLDDALVTFCCERGYPVFRGSETDVLGRYAAATEEFGFDAVLRVCADAPLTDPTGMDELIQVWQADLSSRYVHNRHARGWPIGAAADLIERSALLEASKDAENPFDREHVVPFLQRYPERFGMQEIQGRQRWTDRNYYMAIDYPADLAWFQALYAGTESDLAGPSLDAVYDWVDRTGKTPRLHKQ